MLSNGMFEPPTPPRAFSEFITCYIAMEDDETKYKSRGNESFTRLNSPENENIRSRCKMTFKFQQKCCCYPTIYGTSP